MFVVLRFDDTPTTAFYTLSLHGALPICAERRGQRRGAVHTLHRHRAEGARAGGDREGLRRRTGDRKSTRLNSSHVESAYAVFCMKKKSELLEPIATVADLIIDTSRHSMH